jgi:hypothetical protein
MWWKHEMDVQLTPLQRRLIDANLQRRNRFLYAQKHSRKLRTRQLRPPDQSKKPAEGNDAARELKMTPTLPERDRSSKLAKESGDVDEPKVPQTLSGTSASVPESRLKWSEPQRVAQMPKSLISIIAGAIKYPRLRKARGKGVSEEETEQARMSKCPCCCETIPRHILEVETSWK